MKPGQAEKNSEEQRDTGEDEIGNTTQESCLCCPFFSSEGARRPKLG